METGPVPFIEPTAIPVWVITARLACAALVGGAIGFDRELEQHSAGLRTHMLVALAAAVFSILMLEVLHLPLPDPERVRIDPIRVLEAVTAGVAFLAAGSIIRAGGVVRGLTTGAGLWLAGALGSACGLGYVVIALIAGAIGLVVIVALRFLDKLVWRMRQ
ncbi:putative Mg2+ transporter-C (MgtC) family protein [Amorphus suaedae]